MSAARVMPSPVGGDPLLDAQAFVEVVTHRHLILVGDAEHVADHPHGKVGPQVADEVEPAGADERIENGGAVLTHPASRTDTRRAVKTRAISRRCRLWRGGSSKMNIPLRASPSPTG
jgi:hypothetical protein